MKKFIYMLFLMQTVLCELNAQVKTNEFLALLKNTKERIFTGTGLVDTINAEYTSITKTLSSLIKEGNALPALEIIHELTYYWEMTGQLSEGRKWQSTILKLPIAANNDYLYAWVLMDAGYLAFRQSDNSIALHKTLDAAQIFQRLNDSVSLGRAYVYLARIALRDKKHQDVKHYADSAIAIADITGGEAIKYSALHMLATSYEMQGKYNSAIQLYIAGLRYYESKGDKNMVANEKYNLASNKIKQNKVAEASKLLREALHTAQELEDEQFKAYIIFKYATIATTEKQYQKAAMLYGATDSLFKALEMSFDPAEEKDWKEFTDVTKKKLGVKPYMVLFEQGKLMNEQKAMEIILRK